MMQNLRTIWRFRQEHMRDLRKPHVNHVNHAENGKKYLYDILTIKKETSKPQQ